MKVEYSAQAIDDLRHLASKSLEFGTVVAEAVGAHLSNIIAQIAQQPQSYRKVSQRLGVHVAPLVRFPYVIFYQVLEDKVKILHIRHTSRQSWKEK